MKRFLALTPEERARMGLRGREIMKRDFDRAKVVETTIRAIGLDKDRSDT